MTGVNGCMALSAALTELAKTNDKTSENVDTATANAAMNYLTDVINNTELLTVDQQKCTVFADLASTENVQDGIKAAEESTKCNIASADMNEIIGNDNATISKENYQQATQSQNLTPVYACVGTLTLEAITTSSEIASFLAG